MPVPNPTVEYFEDGAFKEKSFVVDCIPTAEHLAVEIYV